MTILIQRLPSILLAVTLIGACADQGTEPDDPGGPVTEANLFARYVALGNSITAGFQSGGINDSTQRRAYPVLLARQVGASFRYPALAPPGCPAPLGALAWLSGGGSPFPDGADCSRAQPAALVQNLAVPGAMVASLSDNAVAANRLTQLFLGRRTQLEAMIDRDPTLISIWIGNNDALAAALTGDTLLLTSDANFAAGLTQIVTAVRKTRARDVIMIGVAPFPAALQPGAFLWALRRSGQSAKAVSDDCRPFLNGTANPLAANLVSLQILADARVPTVSCAAEAPYLLTVREQETFYARMDSYNRMIRTTAEANGWLYIDPNPILAGIPATVASFRTVANAVRFRLCQGLAGATQVTFDLQLFSTCPSATAENIFGSFLTFDATHASDAMQREIANALIERLNDRHALAIPRL